MEKNLSLKQFIKENCFSISNKLSSKKLSSQLIKNKINDFIELTSFLPLDSSISERIFCIMNDIEELPRCKTCKKSLKDKFIKYSIGYSNYCNSSCSKKNKLVNDKFKKTCIEKYGSEHYWSSDIGKNAIKNSVRNKYGVSSTVNLPHIKEKRLQNLKTYYQDNDAKKFASFKRCYKLALGRNKSNIQLDENWNFEDWKNNNEWKFNCLDCNTDFITKIEDGKSIRCYKCHPHNYSKPHIIVLDIIKKFIDEKDIICNTRSFLPSKKEIDIFIPSKRIGFEINGNYWHGESSRNNSILKDIKFYHQNKTLEAYNNSIKIIQLFEYEIENNVLLESKIKSILNIGLKNINARNTLVKEISFKESSKFLNENHWQGSCNDSVRIGLFHNNELIAVSTFGNPRFLSSNKNEYELIRSCYRIDLNIRGGLGKMISYLKNNFKVDKIISYADLKWSKPKIYEKLGFEEVSICQPNYVYVKHLKKLSRYQCQKKKLSKVLGDKYNPLLSEHQNMLNNNYTKIWDCGNVKYEYTNLSNNK